MNSKLFSAMLGYRLCQLSMLGALARFIGLLKQPMSG